MLLVFIQRLWYFQDVTSIHSTTLVFPGCYEYSFNDDSGIQSGTFVCKARSNLEQGTSHSKTLNTRILCTASLPKATPTPVFNEWEWSLLLLSIRPLVLLSCLNECWRILLWRKYNRGKCCLLKLRSALSTRTRLSPPPRVRPTRPPGPKQNFISKIPRGTFSFCFE